MAKTPEEHLPELRDWDEETFDEHWRAVDALLAEVDHDQASEAAIRWCAAEDAATRAVGLDVLGSLTEQEKRFLPLLLTKAADAVESSDEDVRWSAAHALGRADDEEAVPLLLRFASDPDSDVRWQAVANLPLAAGDELSGDHPVVTALLKALEDQDPHVRDWAAFGLGQQTDVDTPALRDALVRHLEEAEADTAGEAALGLARRGDPRVFDVLAARLVEPDVGNLYVEAAGELADPRLLPSLRQLKTNGWQDDDPRPEVLDEAIVRCSAAADDGLAGEWAGGFQEAGAGNGARIAVRRSR